MRHPLVWFAVFLLAVEPGAVGAQQVSPGDSVRIRIQDDRMTGHLVVLSEFGIEIALVGQTQTETIQLGALRRLEVYRGKHQNLVQTAVAGAASGALAGLIADAVTPCLFENCSEPSTASVIGRGAAIGGALGALIGLIPRDRWETIPLYCLPGGCGVRIIAR